MEADFGAVVGSVARTLTTHSSEKRRVSSPSNATMGKARLVLGHYSEKK